jgi:hypothetical protein
MPSLPKNMTCFAPSPARERRLLWKRWKTQQIRQLPSQKNPPDNTQKKRTRYPRKSEREIDDATKLLHDLGYIFLIPRDTHKPNIFQLDKKGAKLLVGMGVDRESLSVYTGDFGYLDHKEMRDFSALYSRTP